MGQSETSAPAFEDKILALYDEWLADDEFNEKRGLTKTEAQRLVLFAVDLATYGKAVMTGDIEAADG